MVVRIHTEKFKSFYILCDYQLTASAAGCAEYRYRGGHWGVSSTVIPQANFVNYRSFLVQNCKYRVPQDFKYRNTAIFQGKYRNTVRKIS